MNRHYPFDSLLEKVNWVKSNGVEISTLKSFAGNTKVSKMVFETTQKIFDKEPRDSVVKYLRTSWKTIEKKHPEINTKKIRDNIFWYLDGACSWMRYEEISMDEINGK